ncbi:MAG: hypothetical protein ACRC8W_03020 [Plesiomonas shigelloides]
MDSQFTSSKRPKHPESTELREVMLRLGITINEFMREYPQMREMMKEKSE